MTDLTTHLQDYLRLRRSLGFKLVFPGHVLPQLIAYLEAAGVETLTAELAISWARLPDDVGVMTWAHRLGAARGFAKYLQTIDPRTEVPPRDVFGAHQQRPAPYLWSDMDICRLVEAAGRLHPPILAASCETLFGFLATTGMRIGEALKLQRGDVDLASGVVTVNEGKFGRSRMVPLHESVASALASYAARRDKSHPRSRAFFISATGTALKGHQVRDNFNQITTDMGIRTSDVRPRIHDLRHTFAVRTLIGWLRSGADVGAGMPVLSTYLGHVNPKGTYWYLQASPELMELAAGRLDGRFGGRL